MSKQKPKKITQKDILAQVRKPMPPPQKAFDKTNKARYDRKKVKMEPFNEYHKRTYKETILNTAAGDQRVTDTQHSNIGETQYSDGQDYSIPASPILDVTNKEQTIQDVINDLEDLKVQHNWDKPLNNDLIRAMGDTLRGIGIEPTDFDAAIDATPDKQEQYLIFGPSSWEGGNGALNDLKGILSGREPRDLKEDESSPSSDLAGGDSNSSIGVADLNEGKHDARHPGRLKKLVNKRFGKGKITCSKAKTMAKSKDILTKKQANRFLNYHGCR